VGTFVWWPAAVQETPTQAIAVGLAQALGFALLPVVWLVYLEARHQPLIAVATLLLAVSSNLSSTFLPGFGIHVDAPAVGFTTVAMACAWTEARRRSALYRWLGALFLVGAVHSKQVMIPALVAWPAWFFLASDVRLGIRATAVVSVVLLASIALVFPFVDAGAAIFSLFTGPASQPWQGDTRVDAFTWVALDMVARALPTLGLLFVAACAVYRPASEWREWCRANRWVFPLIVGLCCLPTALAGRVKVGGAPNTLAPTLWFLWLAMLTAFASASRLPALGRRLIAGVVLLAACVLTMWYAPNLETLPRLVRETPRPTLAFEAAQRHPGAIYFPSRTLPTLMADGRVDHLDSAVFFRELERQAVDDRFLQAYLPPSLTQIAAEQRIVPHLLPRLPEFRRQIVYRDLPGWIVLTKDDVLRDGQTPAQASAEGSVPERLDVEVVPPAGEGASFVSARVAIALRERRFRVTLNGDVRAVQPGEWLEVDVRLQTRARAHLLTLNASVAAASDGVVHAEWPVFDDLLRPAAHAVVRLRSTTRPPL